MKNSNNYQSTQDSALNSQLSGWKKYAVKGAGVVGGIAAIIFGFWSCISIYPLCIVAGIWDIFSGLFMVTLEAPILCVCLDFLQRAVAQLDERPLWQKGLIYLIISIPGICLCQSVTTFVGSLALFIVASVNGLASISR